MTFNSDRFLWPAILDDEPLCWLWCNECSPTASSCYLRTPPSETMHNETSLPWMPDRQTFASLPSAEVPQSPFRQSLMSNQAELANARSFRSSPVSASAMKGSLR